MKAKINKVTVQVAQGDILALPAAGIVNATTTDLALSPALLAKTGLSVQREVSEIGYCAVGSAVLTHAGNLGKDRRIIHTVGPRWGEGSERGKLSSAVLECLRLAENNKLKSIAFPAVSTGANGYPVENCAVVMLSQIIDFTFEELKSLRNVILCLADAPIFEAFNQEFKRQLEELKSAGEGKVQV